MSDDDDWDACSEEKPCCLNKYQDKWTYEKAINWYIKNKKMKKADLEKIFMTCPGKSHICKDFQPEGGKDSIASRCKCTPGYQRPCNINEDCENKDWCQGALPENKDKKWRCLDYRGSKYCGVRSSGW